MKAIEFLGFYEPFSSWSHLLAAVAALIAMFPLLWRGRGNAGRETSLVIFSVSLVFLFSMSGVFHLLEKPSLARDVLQRLDHAGIWVLIAGTFTPVHMILFRGPWRWCPLAVIWILAITGLVLQIIFFTSFPEGLITSLFLGLGWFGVVSMVKFRQLYRDHTIRWVVFGGLAYSIGAAIDYGQWPILWPGIIGSHELFHVFVILGAGCHWYFIYLWAGHPVNDEIIFLVRIFPNSVFEARSEGENIRLRATSLDDLKRQAREKVRERFHHSIDPAIRLRYFNEEYL